MTEMEYISQKEWREAYAELVATNIMLLEACEKVRPALRWGIVHLPGNSNQWHDCLEQIETAIARAKGEPVKEGD